MSQDLKHDADHLLHAVLDACSRAGDIERHHFRSAGLQVDRKADDSPVTQADRQAETAIRETLAAATPELGLLGEEFGQEGDVRDCWIIDPLDGTKNFVAGLPYFAVLIGLRLDGDLVLGAVHAPALGEHGETWWAIRGQGAWAGAGTDVESVRDRKLQVSSTSSLEQAFVTFGGLKWFHKRGLWQGMSDLVEQTYRSRGFGDWWGHMLVAEGRCDAMVEAEVALHDIAAVKVVVEEAGGAFRARGGAALEAGFCTGVVSSNAALIEPVCRVMGY